MTESVEIKAEKWATKAHSKTNHMYNDMPYRFHLEMVVGYAEKYLHLIPEQLKQIVMAACWAHDTIEDTRNSYNDVKDVLGVDVAEIVYAVTNEKGRNRKEMANAKYYDGIRKTTAATFVKLCDRLANVKYSVEHGSKMLSAYRKEQPNFLAELYDSRYDSMFRELQDLLIVEQNPERIVETTVK